MRLRYNLLIIFLLIMASFSYTDADISDIKPDEKPVIIKLDPSNVTIWENENKVVINQSIIINGGGNLTIINSRVNFSSFDNTGFKLDDGVLFIKDSIIEFGDKIISGKTSGVLILENTTITKSLNDGIELKGDYAVTIKKSTISYNAGHGVQLVSITQIANVTDSSFNNNGKDGFKLDGGSGIVDNSQFYDQGDEGIQQDEGGFLTVTNSKFTRITGDGIKSSDITGDITISNVTVNDAHDDGLQFSNIGGFVSLSNIYTSKIDENGLEVDHVSLKVVDSSFVDGNIAGIELVDVVDVELSNVKITNNEEFAIFALNASKITIDSSEFSNNIAGIELINTTNVEIHMSKFVGNTKFALNATMAGSGNIDVSSNYWGTTDTGNLPILGDVKVIPVLDSNLKEIILTTPTATTEKTTILPLIFSAFILLSIGLTRRYQKRS